MNNQNNYGQPIYNHQASPQPIPSLLNIQLPQHVVRLPTPVCLPTSVPFQQAYINNTLVPNQAPILPNAFSQIAPYPNPQQLLQTTISQNSFLQPTYVQQQPLYRPYPLIPMPLAIEQQAFMQNNYNVARPQFLATNPIVNQLRPTILTATVSVTNTTSVVKSSSADMNNLLQKLEQKKKKQVLPRPPDEPLSTSIPLPPLPESEDDGSTTPSSALKTIVGGASPSVEDKQNYEMVSSPENETPPRNKISVNNSETSQEETVDTLYEISLTTNKTDEDSTENKQKLNTSDRKRKHKTVELYGQHHKRRKSLGSIPLSSQPNSTSAFDEVKNDDTTKKRKKSKKKR